LRAARDCPAAAAEGEPELRAQAPEAPAEPAAATLLLVLLVPALVALVLLGRRAAGAAVIVVLFLPLGPPPAAANGHPQPLGGEQRQPRADGGSGDRVLFHRPRDSRARAADARFLPRLLLILTLFPPAPLLPAPYRR